LRDEHVASDAIAISGQPGDLILWEGHRSSLLK
jgi:hypothetical protein